MRSKRNNRLNKKRNLRRKSSMKKHFGGSSRRTGIGYGDTTNLRRQIRQTIENAERQKQLKQVISNSKLAIKLQEEEARQQAYLEQQQAQFRASEQQAQFRASEQQAQIRAFEQQAQFRASQQQKELLNAKFINNNQAYKLELSKLKNVTPLSSIKTQPQRALTLRRTPGKAQTNSSKEQKLKKKIEQIGVQEKKKRKEQAAIRNHTQRLYRSTHNLLQDMRHKREQLEQKKIEANHKRLEKSMRGYGG
jgi:hypothetical protein